MLFRSHSLAGPNAVVTNATAQAQLNLLTSPSITASSPVYQDINGRVVLNNFRRGTGSGPGVQVPAAARWEFHYMDAAGSDVGASGVGRYLALAIGNINGFRLGFGSAGLTRGVLSLYGVNATLPA